MQVAPGQTVHAGCMVYKDGRFLLQDQTTQEVIELSGPDLAANVGNRVEARGTASSAPVSVAPATSVMNVVSIAPQSQGGCLSVAAALNARTDVPAAHQNPEYRRQRQPEPPQSRQAHSCSSGRCAGRLPQPGMSTGAKVAIVAAVGGGGAGAALALKRQQEVHQPISAHL